MTKTKVASVEYIVTLVISIALIEALESTRPDADGELMRHVEDVMCELEHRWIDESGVDLDLSKSEGTFFVVVDAEDEKRAISQARGVLSIAIHAAGGATPHRPFPRDSDWSVRLLAAWASPRGPEQRAAGLGRSLGDLLRSSGVRGARIGDGQVRQATPRTIEG